MSSLHRLQMNVPSPVRGQQAPAVVTPAGVKPAEVDAAKKVSSQVDVAVLDAFLKARAGETPKQKGLVPGLMGLLGVAPKEAPSKEALALQQRLSGAVQSLGQIYADDLVTEGEMHELHRARGQLHAVLGLASPQVLMNLPKDVRERVQNQLLEPLQVLVDAADRRADRVYSQLQARDEPALRARLQEPPTFRHVDLAGLARAQLTPFALQRYQPGDFVAVPRSDGSVDKGVVVGHAGGELQVEVLDRRTNALGLKSLTAAEVAKANPLKVGDYLEAPGLKLWVTDVGPGGVVGTVQDARGQVRPVDSDVVARIAVEATAAAATKAVEAPAVRTSRQSLDAALDVVWQQKDAFLSGQKNVYSAVYNAVVDKNVLTVPKAAFLDGLAAIARGRPAGSVSNTQGFGGSGDAISSAVQAWKSGQLPAEGRFSASSFEKTFFRFERENWQPDQIRQRVYLNTAADHAPEVMRFVVQQIVDNPARFPGVEMAKLSGPGAVGDRSENIVLYTTGDDASRRVKDAIAQYQAMHPRHFMRETPAFTEAIAPGVATGDEPAVGGGRLSFGSLRADVIEAALPKARDRAHLGVLVDEGLRRMGVDPQQPHKNLQVSRGLS
jgi:hypothetical protein